jgi:hypothetical protein
VPATIPKSVDRSTGPDPEEAVGAAVADQHGAFPRLDRDASCSPLHGDGERAVGVEEGEHAPDLRDEDAGRAGQRADGVQHHGGAQLGWCHGQRSGGEIERQGVGHRPVERIDRVVDRDLLLVLGCGDMGDREVEAGIRGAPE